MAKNGNIHPSRIFKKPEELEAVWERYKESLIKSAERWPKIQYVGKDGTRMTDYPKLPLIMEGLKRYCWDCSIGNIEQYFTNQDNCYDDFIGICRAIKNEIREDQITGGLLNVYNTSITQRLNSLSEKSETTIREQPLFGDE
jgi:hypothetical protein